MLSLPFFTCGFSLRVSCSAVLLLSPAFLFQPRLFLFPFPAGCLVPFAVARPFFFLPFCSSCLFLLSPSCPPLALISCSSACLSRTNLFFPFPVLTYFSVTPLLPLFLLLSSSVAQHFLFCSSYYSLPCPFLLPSILLIYLST